MVSIVHSHFLFTTCQTFHWDICKTLLFIILLLISMSFIIKMLAMQLGSVIMKRNLFLMFLDSLFDLLLLWRCRNVGHTDHLRSNICICYGRIGAPPSQPANCICKHWGSMIVAVPAGQWWAPTQISKCPPCVHPEHWSLPPWQSQSNQRVWFLILETYGEIFAVFMGLLQHLNHHLIIMQNQLLILPVTI